MPPDTPRAGQLGYGDRDAAMRQLRDTAKLERLAMQAGQKIGLRTRRAVTGAFRDGRDPMTALREHFEETRGVLVDLMVTAHLDGRRRTLISAAPRIREVRKLQLATTVFDGALAFLQKRLEASDEDINALRQQYGPEALRVVGAMENKVERQLVGAIQASAAQGETRRQGVKRLRQAFADAGVDPDNAFTFEAVFRTQTQQAYGAGRWNALRNDPAVDEILWGFRYSTVGDDRVRPSHAMLEGTTLPKDDPFWATHWTPNGWACRCQVLEIFRGDEPDAPVQPLTEIEIEGEVIRSGPDPGFAMNAGKLFADPRGLKPLFPKATRISRDEWVERMDQSTRLAFQRYGGDHYREIREYQISGRGTDATARMSRAIEDAVDRVEPDPPQTVYRSLHDLDRATFEKFYSATEHQLNAVASSSRNLSRAAAFLRPIRGGKSVLLEIRTKRSGLSIHDLGGDPEEVLLKRGARYNVVSRELVKWNLSGVETKGVHLILEEID